MLDGVEFRLNTPYTADLSQIADRIIYTGPIDEFYQYRFGALEYRGLRFETKTLDMPNFQGNAVVNFTEREIPYTRVIEHKHFAFGQQPKTIVTYEYPAEWKPGEAPYYPINDERNNALYQKYLAQATDNIIFAGRLGAYRYLDMSVAVQEALDLVKKLV